MHDFVKGVLGREYEVAVKNEIDKLKQHDKKLLGELIAIVKRSDVCLGRPIEDCSNTDESIYLIFNPSKISIVCNKDFGITASNGSKYKLMSTNSFLEQLLEFNFTYLQLLFTGEVIYKTSQFNYIRDSISSIMKEMRNNFFHKQVSLLLGISSDLNKGKFKDDNTIRNRAFIITKVISILNNTMKTGNISINLHLDSEYYSKYVTNICNNGIINKNNMSLLNKEIAKLVDYEINKGIKVDKEDNKEIKLNNKYNIMSSIVYNIMFNGSETTI